MDIRRNGWFGILSVNGKNLVLGRNIVEHGSIMSLVGESLKAIGAERSRPDEDGTQEIILRIRNKPIGSDKESLTIMTRASELDSMLEGSPDGTTPIPGESYEDYYRRLIEDEQLPRATAELLAGQWFDREVNPDTTLWLNDPKAIRFRELNSRDEAFESALPDEYERLKNYVRTTYPDFLDGIVFRTA
jgi:hypothetical protein